MTFRFNNNNNNVVLAKLQSEVSHTSSAAAHTSEYGWMKNENINENILETR